MKHYVAAGMLSLTMMASQAAVFTNANLVKLLDAGMSESVILKSIANNTTKFDTSPDELIKLKNKGASDAVLDAVLTPKGTPAPAGRNAAAATSAPAAPAATRVRAGASINPEEVVAQVNGAETYMQYIVPQIRTAARAFGLGGVASYANLQGVKAARRVPPDGVEFIVSVPKNAQAVGYLTIANFAVRDNGSREVLIGGGFMSYASGISKDRIVATKTEPLANQSRAREGFVLHKVTPERALPAGEYALVLYTQEVRTAGFFANAANSYYDFGVD